MTDWDDAPPDSEAAYKAGLADLATGAGVQRISQFIRRWQHSPLLKIKDVLPYLGRAFTSTNYSSNLYQIEEKMYDNGIGGKVWDDVVNYTINFSLDHNEFSTEDYLTVEAQRNSDINIVGSTLKKAQLYIIKTILRRLEEYKNSTEYPSNDLIDDLKSFALSTEIPPNLVEGLIKRFGLDVYIQVYRGVSNEVTNRIYKSKDDKSLSIFDVARVFNYSGSFKRKDFQRIIQLAEPEAKEYIRGFVYAGAVEVNAELFILDEEMKPMNIDYQSIELPEKIYHYRISAIKYAVKPEELQKWYDIFNEFGIIAQ